MTHIWECEKCGGKTSSDRCPDCGREDDERKRKEEVRKRGGSIPSQL